MEAGKNDPGLALVLGRFVTEPGYPGSVTANQEAEVPEFEQPLVEQQLLREAASKPPDTSSSSESVRASTSTSSILLSSDIFVSLEPRGPCFSKPRRTARRKQELQ